MSVDRYAVVKMHRDGSYVRLGPLALTASAAVEEYTQQLRDEAGLSTPMRLSDDARQALHAVRTRRDAERQRVVQYESCGSPTCATCSTKFAGLT